MSGGWIALFVALWLVVLILLTLVLGLSRRFQALESKLAADSPVDLYEGTPTVGTTLPLDGLRRGPLEHEKFTGAVLLFLDAACVPCRALSEELAAAGEASLSELIGSDVIVITGEGGTEIFGAMEPTSLITDTGALKRSLGIHVSPFGLAVDSKRVVRAKKVLGGLDDVRALGAACAAPLLEVTQS